MAPATADSSADEGEGLNQEIPQLDQAAYDTLSTAVQKAGFNIGTFLQALFTPPQRSPTQIPPTLVDPSAPLPGTLAQPSSAPPHQCSHITSA